MADLRIVDAPEIPTENITGEEKLPTGGSGNYSISLDSLADYTKTKKDLADNTSVDGKVNGVRQELDAHIEDLLNPHQVTKGQIGLGNVDNTADADKPVSNSTQAAIISAVAPKAEKTYVDNQLTLKANKSDVYTKAETYTKQESGDLVNSSISSALIPVNNSLDLAKRGIANRYDPLLIYNSGERVVLANGDIVKSTIPNNTNNPNVDMTGWVKTNDASQIFDESGKTQQEINDNVNIVIRNQDTALSIFKALTPAQVATWKNGTTVDITTALQDIVGNESGRTIWLPKGRALVTDKIHIGNRNVKLKGDVGDRYLSGNGTLLQTNFNGTLFELGDPIPESEWASNLYSGVQGFKLEDLCIYQSNRNTPLNNGNGDSYGSNSIAVQDWGGGDLNFRNVQFEGFKHAVWGLQSDINTFYRLRTHYNKQALFFATKCQQLVIEDIYAFFNDTVIAGSMGSAQIIRPVLVGNGSETDYDIDIYCRSNAIRIVEPWFETLEGTPHKREAYIRVGGVPAVVDGSTSAVNGFEVVAPFVYTNLQTEPNTTKHLVDVGRVIRGVVDEPSCPSNQSLNLAKVVNVLNDSGITNENCRLKINGKQESVTKLYNNAGSTSPNVEIIYERFGTSTHLNSVGRYTFGRVDAVAGSNFMFTSENQAGQFQILQTTYTGGQTTRFHLQKSYQDRASIPTSGAYEQGDYIRNINPLITGVAGSRYVVKGWVRLTTGSNHVLNTDWAEDRASTGT